MEYLQKGAPTKEEVIEYYKHAQVIKWKEHEVHNLINFQDIQNIIYKSNSYWNLPSKTLKDADSIGLWNEYSGYAEIIEFKLDPNDLQVKNTDLQVKNTPSYYDNTHGTIYKVGGQRKWNHYLFDVVKRLERAEKKGEFMSDLDKAIKAIELYRSEAEEHFKTQYEKPND